ncbi:MAG: AAA family ATPase [Candidatus Sabulitectum sp.]|nr:AAA family ATPase [Candidatus Sabulitectum sp.]
MKILNLRFKNLNSLYGEWEIDFTAPEFISDGIFAMTGPTGAGKSTILDAICLALYGSTPRLGKITQSSNEIMSRGTGECFAEVLFESHAGLFRCYWSQHRARRKSSGDLQQPKHEIANGTEDGRIIQHQLRAVQAAVEKITGMDFSRFTRSILLAQGDFDSFLNAEVEKKSKILEQITGTEIYTEISQAVHEKQRTERENLRLLQAEISGIQILEPEEVHEISLELEEKQKTEKAKSDKVEDLKKAIEWLRDINKLKKDLDSLNNDSSQLKQELEFFIPKREKLKGATAAAGFEGEYATLTGVREQMNSDSEALGAAEDKLPGLQVLADTKKKSFDKAEESTAIAKSEFQKASPLIRETRKLDTRLSDGKKTLQRLEEDCRNDADLIEEDKKNESAFRRKLDALGKELKSAKFYLDSHSDDQWLVGGFSGIEERLSSLQEKNKEIKAKEGLKIEGEKVVGKAMGQLAESRKKHIACIELMQKTVDAVAEKKSDLEFLLKGRLLREYRTDKDSLLREKALLDKIADLESHRLQLLDGKPCPLCGAEKHPYAEGNVPVQDEVDVKIMDVNELIGKAEEFESIIGKLEHKEKEARKNLSKSEMKELESSAEVKTAKHAQSALERELSKMNSSYADLKNAAFESLQFIGVKEIPDDVDDLIQSLGDRLEKWQGKKEEQTTFSEQQVNYQGKLKTLGAVIETKTHALAGKKKDLFKAAEEFKELAVQRKDIFGEKNPAVEENRLNTVVAESEQLEKQAGSELGQVQKDMISLHTEISSLKKRIKKQEPELKILTDAFTKGINLVGFLDETQFQEACLDPQERDKLISDAKSLDHRQTKLKAITKERKNRLSCEIVKAVTDKKQEELEPLYQENAEELNQLKDVIAGIKTRLLDNDSARAKIAEKQGLIDAQKKECSRWDKLHGLIGSADGKKYRNFAQGITFEMMVSHANIQLQKMTDRYLLIRNKDNPLELNVIDNWQAGETRSVRNLSGGESFIVSLSLALGLSKMASRKVRVDSLFLDEGFGTLDEESLETALETLAGLQQGGKLIGIISHVSALKERIRTQISVKKVSGGKSIISGPGCRFIS